MVFSKENYKLAAKYIGKQVKCWSDDGPVLGRGIDKSNVYIGTLLKLSDVYKHFVIDEKNRKLYEKRVSFCRYKTYRTTSSCFEFIELIEEKDKNGNFLLEF